jgi:hypothetical protein
MSANSPPAAVTISVARSDVQSNWWSWLQSMAAAINQLAAWCNRPQLAPLTVDTLPAGAVAAGTLAYVTDSTTSTGVVGSGGGTTPVLCWFNGADWIIFS